MQDHYFYLPISHFNFDNDYHYRYQYTSTAFSMSRYFFHLFQGEEKGGNTRGIDRKTNIAHNISVKPKKIAQLARSNPAGVRFSDLCKLAEALGFTFQRQKGSHKVFAHDGLRQIMGFQNDHGMAKPYQVRQLLDCADKNNLSLGE